MKQILPANDATMKILGKPVTSDAGYRLLRYCTSLPVEDGVLLFNLLTRELLLLTEEEYANVLTLPELREKWFVVPENTNEKKTVETIRLIQRTMAPPPKYITSYKILPTTDCNARCFYCFELGRSRIPMSEETALRTVAFIKENCGGNSVRLFWFGGEPLFNHKIIDLISNKLRECGIKFFASMISNGYLFDDELVEKAKNSWNLKNVQITLDGTEAVYNRSKAYIYRNGSAYQVVMANIDRLLKKGFDVSIRLNLDFHNADDLMALADILAERFAGQPNFYVYCHLIFDDKKTWDQRYSMEKWEELYALQHRLQLRLLELGISDARSWKLRKKLRQHHCIADNPEGVVILPDGNLGVCEHFSEDHFIGHMNSPARDQKMIASFRKRCDEIPACDTCFYYPECVRLEKCPELNPCFPPEQADLLWRTQVAMRNEYQIWKENNKKEG